MSIYAQIENGVVTNRIEWDGVTKYNPGPQYTLVIIPDGVFVDMGYLWDATNGFTAPPVTDTTQTQPVTQ
jgi:hypothetical protein